MQLAEEVRKLQYIIVAYIPLHSRCALSRNISRYRESKGVGGRWRSMKDLGRYVQARFSGQFWKPLPLAVPNRVAKSSPWQSNDQVIPEPVDLVVPTPGHERNLFISPSRRLGPDELLNKVSRNADFGRRQPRNRDRRLSHCSIVGEKSQDAGRFIQTVVVPSPGSSSKSNWNPKRS